MNRNADLLDTDDVNFFQNNGYWISPKIITDERLEQLRIHMEMVYHEQHETGQANAGGWNYRTGDLAALRKTDSVHFSDRVLYDLATDPAIGEIAAKLMKADRVRLFDTQLLHKPGRVRKDGKAKTNVGWHQDYSYWKCCAQPTLLTAWVAFDDMSLDNGCMQVIPRSHRWGMVNISDFFEQNLAEQEHKLEVPAGEVLEKKPLIMKAGQVSFHHCYEIHGSGPNTTDKPRRSLAIHLMTGDTRYSSAGVDYMAIKMAKLQDGDFFSDNYFPILNR